MNQDGQHDSHDCWFRLLTALAAQIGLKFLFANVVEVKRLDQ